MEIDRKELLKALKVTHHATKDGERESAFPFEKFVMLNGPGQCVMATNLELDITVPLEITLDATPEPVLPEEDMLDGLKAAQMKSLAGDYGIEVPKSAKKVDEIRETIMEACRVAAAKEVENFEEVICLPGKDLAKILTELGEETVELIQDAEGFVSIGDKFHNLRTFPSNESPSNYVTPGEDDSVTMFNVPMSPLEKVALAVKGSDGRGGIVFDAKEGYVVATDGHRLHRTPLSSNAESETEVNFYIPSDVIPCLKSIFGKDGTVELAYWDDRIYSKNADGASVTARCPTAIPFNWKAVMTEGDKEIIFTKKDFQKPLAQAQTLADASYNKMKVKFNGGIEMEMTHPNKGGYQNMHIPIKNKNYGDDIEVLMCLNSYFFMDALRMAEKDDDEVKIGFSDATHPVFFKHKEIDGMIMPMRF